MNIIDDLPSDWSVRILGDVSSQRKEAIDPNNADFRYVGLEHIDSGSPILTRFGSSAEVRSSKSRFYKGDILYGKLRPYLDKSVLATIDGICSTDIIVLKAEDSLFNDYLVHVIHTKPFLEYATKTMTGVNHPRTSWHSLKLFSVPLPPLPEQIKIATILSSIQEARDKRAQLKVGGA